MPHLDGPILLLGKLGSYALLLAAAAGGAATLYRYGPDRQKAKWTWITPGSVLASVGWIVLTLGFGFYAANFGNYGKTYGSLATVVVSLTWMYLSAYILLFGAELNSELEHQTAQDTTTGPATPLGERGAWMADHVADGSTSETATPERFETKKFGAFRRFSANVPFMAEQGKLRRTARTCLRLPGHLQAILCARRPWNRGVVSAFD